MRENLPSPGFFSLEGKKVFGGSIDTTPLYLSLLRKDVFYYCPAGVVSEEASSAQPLGVCWIRFKEKLKFRDHGGGNPDCPQRGPCEASEGIFPGHGQ